MTDDNRRDPRRDLIRGIRREVIDNEAQARSLDTQITDMQNQDIEVRDRLTRQTSENRLLRDQAQETRDAAGQQPQSQQTRDAAGQQQGQARGGGGGGSGGGRDDTVTVQLDQSYVSGMSVNQLQENLPRGVVITMGGEEVSVTIEKRTLGELLSSLVKREWTQGWNEDKNFGPFHWTAQPDREREVKAQGGADNRTDAQRKIDRLTNGGRFMPFSKYITDWEKLDDAHRYWTIWEYDHVLLRVQYIMTAQYMPSPARTWWRKKVKADIERLYDDVDEEIYYEGQFMSWVNKTDSERKKDLEMMKKAQDDLEEEVSGYDKFTVEEEKQIAAQTKKEIDRMMKVEITEEYL